MSDADSQTALPTSVAATPDQVDEIIYSVFERLRDSRDVDDIEKALNLAKTNSEIKKMRAEGAKAEADARKAALDARLSEKQMRHALLGAMFAPLVPLASLLTVIVTLFVSSEQMRSSSQLALQKLSEDKVVREEASWRAFEEELDKSQPDKLYSSPTFLSRLRTFAASGTHDQQMQDITRQFMIGLTSDYAFQAIWKIHLKNSIEELTNSISDPSVLKITLLLKDSIWSVSSTLVFISQEIAGYLHSSSNGTQGPKEIDLSNINLQFSDLDNVDFSKIDLRQTSVIASTLRGAILKPKAGDPYDFRGSTWWDASEIDQKIIPTLILNFYPERPEHTYPQSYSITKEQYAANVARLCTQKLKLCSNECLRFGSEPRLEKDAPVARVVARIDERDLPFHQFHDGDVARRADLQRAELGCAVDDFGRVDSRHGDHLLQREAEP